MNKNALAFRPTCTICLTIRAPIHGIAPESAQNLGFKFVAYRACEQCDCIRKRRKQWGDNTLPEC